MRASSTSVRAKPAASSPTAIPSFQISASIRASSSSSSSSSWEPSSHGGPFGAQQDGPGPTGQGILIGILSAFGSALFVGLMLGMVYFLRFTRRGRILLDRVGRPGAYDDEQAFLREEAEALETMDDSQRHEYLRAKGWLPSRRVLNEC